MNMEFYMTSDIFSQTNNIESSVQDLELQMLYFQNLNDTHSCDFLNEIIRNTNNQLDQLSEQISGYTEDRIIFSRMNVENLKKKYTSLLIKDWLLQNQVKTKCGTDTVSVLYFYKRKNCNDCIIQGNVLTSLKDEFRERLMVFPLDIDVGSPMIAILMRRYNITSTPSVIIEDGIYTRLLSRDELKDSICYYFVNMTGCLK